MNLIVKIKGMHCDACARLIKQNLENQSGITSAKVDLKSETATVDFRPEQVKREDILNIIKISGDYEVEEVVTQGKKNNKSMINEVGEQNSSVNMFIWGLLGGVAVMSILLNIIFGIMLFKAK